MPIPSKPCPGELSQETQQLLRKTRDRARWGTYRCKGCGRRVGVQEVGGQWIPEQHWPSIVYALKDKDGRRVKPVGGLPTRGPTTELRRRGADGTGEAEGKVTASTVHVRQDTYTQPPES